MSAYLKFFKLEQSPFQGKAQAQVVLGTKALRGAFAMIQQGLEEDAARICVSGEAGLGKTSLARALPKLLGDAVRVAVVLDPSVSWQSLRGSIARQWGLASGGLARAGLIEAARRHRLVLVIDRAEGASEEFLDHIDVVLSYRTEEDRPVVQCVLLARLSGHGSQPPPIIWWLDRIQTLQLEFAPLPREGIESYIHKHLKRAGWRGQRLFSQEAAHVIHEVSGGIPGEVSKLCEELLASAAAQNLHGIDAHFVRSICDDDATNKDVDHDDDPPEIMPDTPFEELVLKEEFGESVETAPIGADTIFHEGVERPEIKAEAPPTLTETLEFFERTETVASETEVVLETPVSHTADGWDEAEEWNDDESSPRFDAEEPIDDAITQLEDYLSSPTSTEELRTIRGSVLGRHVRAFVAAAIAAVLGGLAIAWLSGGSEPVVASIAKSAGRTNSDGRSNGSIANSNASRPVLGRIRGPVTQSPKPPVEAAVAQASSIPNEAEIAATGSDRLSEVDFEDSEEDDDFADDDAVDMRPASMLPGATPDPKFKGRF